MISNSGIGKVETFLYFIENPGTERLYELHIGAVTMNSGPQQVVYYGKVVLEGKHHPEFDSK